MNNSELATLASIAASDVESDEPVGRALAILRDHLGAASASLVYGARSGFRNVSSGDELELTPVALWLIQRDLVSRGGLCAFDRTGARVINFRPAGDREPCDYVASLLPTPASAAQMIIVKGPWRDGGLDTEFLAATAPALTLVAAKRIERLGAAQGQYQLSALMNIAQVISQSQDIEQVLTNIARGVAAFADVEYVTIDVTNEDGDATLRCVNYDVPNTGEGIDRWKRAIARPDPLRRDVVRSRQPALFADAQNDERLPVAARTFFENVLIRSTAIFPMVAQNDLIGVMSVGALHPLKFDAAECAMFEGLATQAATAVSGIRLYEQLAEKSAQLETALQAEHERARRDSLTGTWNHAETASLLQGELARQDGAYVAVAMIDVDGMKAINDTYGHLAGDDVLKRVAETLSQEGAIVGRYGGDEFLVVLRGMHRARAQAYVDQVVASVSELRVVDRASGGHVRAAISVGLAIFPDEGADLVELIRTADAAMYAAKLKQLEAEQGGRRLSDRVARLIDDLVPLLTSSAGLDDKLTLVAQRLSDGATYDAVECRLFPSAGGEVPAHCVLLDGKTSPLTQAWREEQDAHPEPKDRPTTALMDRTHRPVITEDAQLSEQLTAAQRDLLAAMGLRSSMSIPMLWQGQMIGQLTVASRSPGAFSPMDAQFLSSVATQVSAIVRMATLVDGLQTATHQLETSQAETVMMLAAAAEAHDHTTGLHLQSIRAITETLARELGYTEEEVRELGLAATLHDIGKISVPDSILSSPMRFERDDWEMSRIWDLLKRHSVWGAEFLQGRAGFDLASQVARWHHESWDASGYPDGLAADEIPEKVAIVTVADAFDAMTSERPYRAARSAGEAVEEIIRCKGKQFNPRVVDALARLYSRRALPTSASLDLKAA